MTDPSTSRSDDSSQQKVPTITSSTDGRTLLRQSLTPYLPPPVVKAIGQVDPLLEPLVGPEASITLSSTLLLCFLIWKLIGLISGISQSGKAIADDDDEGPTALATDDFGDTVILCGPMWSGKTRIFYHLLQGDAHVPTVMSLRANAALLYDDENGIKQQSAKTAIRVLDYPGHAGLQDDLFLEFLKSSKQQVRFVLVVDATQSVTAAADCLYDLLQHAKNAGATFQVFVACHKRDLSSSKNPRRIKISLRSELEKLVQVRSTKAATAEAEGTSSSLEEADPWWKKGQTLDLDSLDNAKLCFEATTCSVNDGIDSLKKFCKNGTMP